MQKVEANPDSSSFWRMLQRPRVEWVQPWAANCRVHRPGTPWQALPRRWRGLANAAWQFA